MEVGGGLTERRDGFDPASGRTLSVRACNHCRVKKLKCTGNRSGCQRCKDLSRTCSYGQQGTGSQHRQRSRRSRQQDSTLGAKGDHHDQRLVPARQDDENTSAAAAKLKDAEANNSKMTSEPPAQRLVEYESHGSPPQAHPQQQTPPQVVQSQASYCAATFPDPPLASATDLTSDGCGFGDGAMVSPFHFDDFLGATGGDTSIFSSDLMTLGASSKREAQPSIPTSSQASTSENPPVSELSPDCTVSKTQELHLQQHHEKEQEQERLISDSLYGFTHVSSDIHSSTPCLCLHRIIVLMDEVEVILGEPAADDGGAVSAYDFDVVLATNKEALQHGRAALDCNGCARSIETMIVLTFLAEKLARMCLRVVAQLGEKAPAAGSLDVPCSNVFCGFGSYEVESWEEFRPVLFGLLELQLCGLRALLKQLDEISQWMNSDTMARRLAATDGIMTQAFSLLPPRTK